MSELADERDLGSRTERCAGSSPAFPTEREQVAISKQGEKTGFGLSLLALVCSLLAQKCGSGSVVEHLLAKERVASSNLVFRSKHDARQGFLASSFLMGTIARPSGLFDGKGPSNV